MPVRRLLLVSVVSVAALASVVSSAGAAIDPLPAATAEATFDKTGEQHSTHYTAPKDKGPNDESGTKSTVPDGLCGRVTRPSGLRTMHGGRPDGLVDIGPARPGWKAKTSVLLTPPQR
jgi:hypothetical protein